ncbi:MAG: glycosyltransferase family 4 protein [Planctomycetota bacterium]
MTVSTARASRPRVLLLSDAVRFGGAEEYLALLAEGLDQSGFETEIVVAAPTLAPAWRNRLETTGRPWRHLPVASCQSRSPLRQPQLVPAYFRLIQSLRQHAVDLLHFNLPGPYDALISWAAVAARRAGIPGVVATEHLPCVPRYRKLSWLKVRAHRCVDRVVTISQSNRRLLIENHRVDPDRIAVIPNGIDPEPFARVAEPVGRPLIIGVVGRLDEQKGHDLLLDALSRCRADIRARFIGSGPWRVRLEAHAEELDLDERVEFRGFRQDLVSELEAIDLLVMPSRHEGLPLALLEAMAAGRGAVAFDVGGISEVIEPERSGVLVPAGDVAALARVLDRLAEDPALVRRFGVAARERVRRTFARDRMIEQTASVYRQVLAQRGIHRMNEAEALLP